MGKSTDDLLQPFNGSLTHSAGLYLAASPRHGHDPLLKAQGLVYAPRGSSPVWVQALGVGALEPVGNPGAALPPWPGGSRGSCSGSYRGRRGWRDSNP